MDGSSQDNEQQGDDPSAYRPPANTIDDTEQNLRLAQQESAGNAAGSQAMLCLGLVTVTILTELVKILSTI